MSQSLFKQVSMAPKKPRQPLFTLAVTVPRLIAGIIAGFIALGWIFLLGMVAGRVYPEMLSREPKEQARIAEKADSPPAPPSSVLQPEDLEYKQRAASSTRAATPPQGASSPAPAATPNNAAAPASGAISGALGSANATPVASGQIGSNQAAQPPAQTLAQAPAQAPAQPAVQAPAQPVQQAASQEDRFSFTYQVASFKERNQAQALINRLTADGVNCRIEEALINAVAWYRVLAFFEGTEAETRTVHNILGKYGISQVLVRNKSPVRR